ncbi:MAG: hypothetical protein K2N30_01570 [Clostridia bacterium]|nr:hypothetical protein [Clostridia bacterium]
MAEKKTLAERREKINTVKKELKKRVAQKIAPAQNTVSSNRLKLLVTVVGRRKAEYFADLLQAFEINMQVITLANGTADAKMMNYLGLSDTDKAVIFSVIQENKVNDALHLLEYKFNTIKDGKGIAFTIPLSSVIGTLIYGFLSNNRTVVKEDKNNG